MAGTFGHPVPTGGAHLEIPLYLENVSTAGCPTTTSVTPELRATKTAPTVTPHALGSVRARP
eukprot:7630907-Pyramimonas_sp.AAC.1